MTTQRFAGKLVLVTGGSSGIGRASALAFAQEGAASYMTGNSLIVDGGLTAPYR